MRLGGEIEIRPEDFGGPMPPVNWPRPQADHFLWTDSGRSALYLAAREHAARRGTMRAHVPAFSCSSVTEALVSAGYDVVYYDRPPGMMQGQLPDLARDELLIVIHYFGLENPDYPILAERALKTGVRIVEDCVQASINRRWCLKGDFAITSLRKFLSVPDGACLLSSLPVRADLLQSDEGFVSRRTAAKVLRASTDDAQRYLRLIEESEESLSAGSPRRPSTMSALLMSNQDVDAISARRRENWRRLERGLAPLIDNRKIKQVLTNLREEEVPLGFPIALLNGERDRVRAELRHSGVFCPVHWPLPHLPEGAAPLARNLSQNILTLPLDQRYDPPAMDALAQLLMELLA